MPKKISASVEFSLFAWARMQPERIALNGLICRLALFVRKFSMPQNNDEIDHIFDTWVLYVIITERSIVEWKAKKES